MPGPQTGAFRGTVDEVWEMIMSFSGYSFCKPHSASYALVSYKSCYLRAHYPAEFIAAVLTNQGGYYSSFAYVSEARRMGLRVLLPDVNESRKAYWGKDQDPCRTDATERACMKARWRQFWRNVGRGRLFRLMIFSAGSISTWRMQRY